METEFGAAGAVHVVASAWVERGYPGDGASVARGAWSLTAHLDPGDAASRLLAELDADISPQAALSVRRSYLVECAVPESMRGGGCPLRWASDRAEVLLSRAGARPGLWWRAVQRGEEGPMLAEEMASDARRLAALLAGRRLDQRGDGLRLEGDAGEAQGGQLERVHEAAADGDALGGPARDAG